MRLHFVLWLCTHLEKYFTKSLSLVHHLYHFKICTPHFILSGYFRMTDEERNELEKQMKALQESYNLFFSDSLKQLQDSQTIGDVKVEEKVILLKHEAISRFLVLLHDCSNVCQW